MASSEQTQNKSEVDQSVYDTPVTYVHKNGFQYMKAPPVPEGPARPECKDCHKTVERDVHEKLDDYIKKENCEDCKTEPAPEPAPFDDWSDVLNCDPSSPQW